MTFSLTGLAHLSITINLVSALILGALIGLERQISQRYTGVATHALVALGAAAFTAIPTLIGTVGDPTRIAGQVVTGIGFLGAGLIFRDGPSVKGLSAAASIWATGAVGALAGFGFLLEAVEVAILMAAANLLLPLIGRRVDRFAGEARGTSRAYSIELTCALDDEGVVRAKLMQALLASRLRLSGVDTRHGLAEAEAATIEAHVSATGAAEAAVERLVGELALSRNVVTARWRREEPI